MSTESEQDVNRLLLHLAVRTVQVGLQRFGYKQLVRSG
jgi:hypothetical protein